MNRKGKEYGTRVTKAARPKAAKSQLGAYKAKASVKAWAPKKAASVDSWTSKKAPKKPAKARRPAAKRKAARK